MSEESGQINNFNPRKIILPILLGLGAVGYLMYREFDAESFARIEWRLTTAICITCAILLTCVRVFANMWRIRVLAKYELNKRQAFEIVTLWEFSSAATPSMVGGTAAGLYLLTKDGIKLAKATAIIFGTVFLDSIFFLGTISSLWIYYGNLLISPNLGVGSGLSLMEAGGWVYAFLGAYIMMITYTSFFAYGLFINPQPVKWLLDKITRLPVLKRWNEKANAFGDEFKLASVEIRKQGWLFWAKGFFATGIAWTSRFLVVVFLVTAFVQVNDYLLLYGRQLSLYLILFLTPTPGGSGVAEFAFEGFYMDFIGDAGLGILIAGLWRLLTYYPYLILGVVVLPNWISRVFNKKEKPTTPKGESTLKATGT